MNKNIIKKNRLGGLGGENRISDFFNRFGINLDGRVMRSARTKE